MIIKIGVATAIVVGLLVSFARTSPHTPGVPVSGSLYLSIYTEAMEPVSGGRVLLTSGTSSTTLLTDAQGATPFVATSAGTSYDVFLKQKNMPYGLVLGQAFTDWSVPAPLIDVSGFQTVEWESVRTQPVLRPVQWDSTQVKIQTSEDALWYFSVDAASTSPATYSFPVLAGSLSSPRSVYAFLEYCSIEPLEDDYRSAFAVQTTDEESLGDEGAVLALRCHTLGFAAPPVVDVYFIASSAADLGGSTLENYASSFEYDSTLRLGLSGTLGKGTTLFLLRSGNESYGVTEFLADPPAFPPFTAQTQTTGGGGSGGQGECSPLPPPDPDASSQPDPPQPPSSSDSRCAFPPEKTGSKSSRTAWRPIGPLDCPSGGGGHQSGASTVSWGASFSGTFNIKDIVEVEAGGEYSNEETVAYDYNIGPGHDCGGGVTSGQCAQVYKRRTVTSQSWIREWPSYGMVHGGPFAPIPPGSAPFLGCLDDEVTTVAVTEARVQQVCDRPCP